MRTCVLSPGFNRGMEDKTPTLPSDNPHIPLMPGFRSKGVVFEGFQGFLEGIQGCDTNFKIDSCVVNYVQSNHSYDITKG